MRRNSLIKNFNTAKKHRVLNIFYAITQGIEQKYSLCKLFPWKYIQKGCNMLNLDGTEIYDIKIGKTITSLDEMTEEEILIVMEDK